MRKVEVIPFQDDWKVTFQQQQQQLQEMLNDLDITIHHIGSTSIKELAAKPIIDLLLEVHRLEDLDVREEGFRDLGFIPQGENGIKNRRYYYKEDGEGRRLVHLHCFPYKDPNVVRHIAFRDYLIEHKEERELYGQLKLELAKKHHLDIESYIAGKQHFVQELEQKALNWYNNRLTKK